MSRDFWMPDQSCRICYECDSQFTLFNRRHHCRLCGRIFCAKCSSNWIPSRPSSGNIIREESEKIRACNYCFKQWQQGGLAGSIDHGIQDSSLDLSTSPSAASLISTKSSGTVDSSSIAFTSVPHSVRSYHHPHYPSELTSYQSTVMESNLNEQNDLTARNNELLLDTGTQSPNGDDFDEEFAYQLATSGGHVLQIKNDDYDELLMGDMDTDYESQKLQEPPDATSVSSSSLQTAFDATASEPVQIEKKEDSHTLTHTRDVSDECEPVDFENNEVLWLPPEPEDEEDEREARYSDSYYDEDDDYGDAAREWASSSNLGSGECRNKEKSNEELKKAMKNVVDGNFRTLVSQLLQVEDLANEEDEKDSWLEIIISLSWEAASLFKPDTSKGGGMDPGEYVKIKCLASGSRTDSIVIKGVVCKKNVAHKYMMSRIERPRLLILGGALEYQRVSNHLSSFGDLLQQEMDHLRMAVAKIEAHRPNVLLVEKSVSRNAQEYLLGRNISTVLNIKRPLLERIARCTGAQIVPSIDHLSSQKLGYADMFHVERFQEEHGSAGQNGKKLVKTLMYFEGCPKPFGCTILLRGASGDELKKVKHVVQYGVFVAYHLALETSFLADEGASLPELLFNSTLTDKASSIDRSIPTIPGFTTPVIEKEKENEKPQIHQSYPDSQQLNSVLMSEMFSTIINQNPESKPFQIGQTTEGVDPAHIGDYFDPPQNESSLSDAASDASSIELDVKNGKEDFFTTSKEESPPSPSDRQSILVSLSSRCVWKGTVCEPSHSVQIKYYGKFDKQLGRFLRDDLFDQRSRCHSCDMTAEAHVQCFTHRQGTLTISVKRLPMFSLPGEIEGKIWMWHRCLRCPWTSGVPPATRRIVMSDAAWGLSFGKFLELSFSNHVASCGHSLHRDCLRFYGFGQLVACFRYASIDVHSVFLPPHKLDFKYENQEWNTREADEFVYRSDTVVPVYDDEPTTIISYALISPDYMEQVSDDDSIFSSEFEDSSDFQSCINSEIMDSESFYSLGDDGNLSMSESQTSLMLDPVSHTKSMHPKVEFTDDSPLRKVRYSVTTYYAKRFEALRRICCPSKVDYIRSLSRCKKWDAQGGKSNVFFTKTLDDRFIIKQVTKTELESFIRFAPAYFKYLSESIGIGSSTCLAKILGIYQVAKQMKDGKERKVDVLVMENLFYGRNITRLYDLKGSSWSRYNPDSSGSNKVLLDQNLIETMPTSPIFVGNKAKRLLERAVWNDTSFLDSVNVMDYSLLVGVDEEKHELVLGIINFMRQYTWDKYLETWVKASGILGGPKNASPTVISPQQYKKRFRKAMSTYFLMVPN